MPTQNSGPYKTVNMELKVQRNILLMLLLVTVQAAGQQWPADALDDILDRMNNVNSGNCESLDVGSLRLPSDTLPQLPRYSRWSDQRAENRSLLWEAHNMALSKAISSTFALSRFNVSSNFQYMPGLMYHYMSAVADVVTNTDRVTGSGIFYDSNSVYANWFAALPFNLTLPLFGPRAFETDGTSDISATDYGAGPNKNYTTDAYKHNPWYALFLPDDEAGLDSTRKWSYQIQMKYAQSQDFFNHVLFSAALPEDEGITEHEPVLFTMPYFDCGRTNKWIVSAVSPFTDFLPRYLDWFHLRRHRFVGEMVTDVEFRSVDMNQCPLGVGNEAPNRFAGTARCKQTTFCSPLAGFGLTRGGYECICNPGLVYPPGQNGPFQGIDIENATFEDYVDGFDCISPAEYSKMNIEHNVRPAESNVQVPVRKRKFVPRYDRKLPKEKPLFDLRARFEADKIMLGVQQMKIDNRPETSPLLPAEIQYGATSQFQSQENSAARLANFLGNFLQNLQTSEAPDDPREDKPFHRDSLIGEVLGIVMSDPRILGAGIFFDENKYNDPENNNGSYFGPYAYRPQQTACKQSARQFIQGVKVRDRSSDGSPYVEEPWFTEVKDRWTTGDATDSLQRVQQRLHVRSDVDGSALENFRRYPMEFRFALAADGYWSDPYCPCDGEVETFLITYSVPFFGPTPSGDDVEFIGVVTVDVPFDSLNINQCYQPYWIPNVFKNTAMCDYTTTECTPLSGRGLLLGQYECRCKSGHVYPEGVDGPFTAEQVEEAYIRGEVLGCIPIVD